MDDLSRQPAPIRVRDFVRVLRKRAAIGFFTFVLVIVVANVLTSRMRPVYEATTRLLIDSPVAGSAATTGVAELLRGAAPASDLDVEMEKIRSRSFMQTVVDRAGMPPGTPPEAIMGSISLNATPDGRILTITSRSHIADEAQKLSATVAKTYIESANKEFDEKNDLSEKRLRGALATAQAEKERDDQAFNAFTSRMGLSNPTIFYDTQARKTVDVRNALADAQKNLPLMEQSLANLNTQLKQIPSEMIPGYSLNKDAVVDGYRDEIVNLQTKRGDMLLDYAPDSLEIQDIDRQIENRRKALLEIQSNGGTYSVGSKSISRNPDYSKVQSQIFDTEIGIKSSRQNITALQKQLAGLEAEQKTMAQQLTNYDTLRRARDSATEAFERVRQGLVSMSQSRVTSAPYIKVLDEAQLPMAPLSPKPLLNNLLAAGLGIVLGIAMALAAEILSGGSLADESIEYLPRIAGVPVLGVIPGPLSLASLAPHSERDNELPVPQRGMLASGAATEDVLREIGYVLAHRERRGPAPVVLLTSTRTGETTAVLSAQLAAALVREGLRVTLVDADRQQPRLNQVFGAPDAPGLTDAVAKRRRLDDILHIGADGRLRFLAAGAPDDTVVLTERGLRPIFRQLSSASKTDIVLVSGPTVWSARLVSPLERAASGMVLIATGDDGDETAGSLRKYEDSVARVRRILSNGHVPRILGVIAGRGIATSDLPMPSALVTTNEPVTVAAGEGTL